MIFGNLCMQKFDQAKFTNEKIQLNSFPIYLFLLITDKLSARFYRAVLTHCAAILSGSLSTTYMLLNQIVTLDSLADLNYPACAKRVVRKVRGHGDYI